MKIYRYETNYKNEIKIYELEYEEKNKIYKRISGSISSFTNLKKENLDVIDFDYYPVMYSLSKDKVDYFKEKIILCNQEKIEKAKKSISIYEEKIKEIKKADYIYCFDNSKEGKQDDE